MTARSTSYATTALFVACAALALGACSSTPELPRGMQTYSEAREAYINILPTAGHMVTGQLRLDPFASGIRLSGRLQGFPAAGQYAFHIREHGSCDGDAASVGGIFNPLGTRHGRYGHGEHMLGDMDNLEVAADGAVQINRSVQGLRVGGGDYNDIADRSFVIHALADDYNTQPDGNAGRPIACGVVQVVNPPPPAG